MNNNNTAIKKYSFFKISGSAKLASNKGKIRGMVNHQTGEIIATQTFGTMLYYERYELNINDAINAFAYTEKDVIIRAARRAMQLNLITERG